MFTKHLKPVVGVPAAAEIWPLELLKEVGVMSGHNHQSGALLDLNQCLVQLAKISPRTQYLGLLKKRLVFATGDVLTAQFRPTSCKISLKLIPDNMAISATSRQLLRNLLV